MIKAAYLRVYLPAGNAPTMHEHRAPVLPGRVITIGDIGVWQESLVDDAFDATWEGRQWVCPRYPRLRMLEGLLAFRNAYPGMVGSMLAPERVVVNAAAELESLRDRRPDVRSYILTSSWHVPLRWFAAFRPEEREITETPEGATTVRYRTEMAEARRRLSRAIEVLDDAGFDDTVVGQVADLKAWLEGFVADSMVELDYGSVATMFSDGELALDESASDVASSLNALEEGDLDRAGAHYATAASRWAAPQAMLYAN